MPRQVNGHHRLDRLTYLVWLGLIQRLPEIPDELLVLLVEFSSHWVSLFCTVSFF